MKIWKDKLQDRFKYDLEEEDLLAIESFIQYLLDERTEECARISDKADELKGGAYGGPLCCEYGCNEIISNAIRALNGK